MRRLWIVLAACLAVIAAACGDDGGADGATPTTEPAAATEPAGDGDATELAGDAGDRPERIMSLSPTATEILYAIGAGDQVVAVDEMSDHPPEAPVTELSGFEPSLEGIASYDPDLVILSFDPAEIVDGLDRIGVTALVQPTARTLDDAYAQITELGEATGNVEAATELVAEIEQGLDEAAALVAEGADGDPIRLYHEVDDTFYSVASSSFTGAVYQLIGLDNIADEADDGSGYPQLNAEYVLEADPELIIITDEIGYTPPEMAARPGWSSITAIAQGDVLQLDADLPSRWGPRVVEFARVVAEHVAEMQAR